MYKWIGAMIGAYLFRFPGLVAGFFIGYVIEQYSKKIVGDVSGGNGRNRPNFSGRPRVSPSDFELNLLSLASIIIKADGAVNQTELNYVRQYFVQAYGKERANATFKTFNEVIKSREINTIKIASFIAQNTRYESRLQILHFLFGIAAADGHVSTNEVNRIREIAGAFRINQRDFESIKAMFFKEADNAYKILEIDKSATDSEVKKAYRTMVKKYHPDKLQHLPPHLIKGAEEKFQSVQQAYEQLQKERGFK
ncbi:TerB family tellurite resistance protein [Aquimarina agarilytica]|uniref:TerB family tellurite resistance protein n=1 Tax=Aquimarina agarilytica TaxID=1087449 RepID=UPI0002881E96|nr:TerB family tellurite resistance protein [Aquimarina agarilytica]